MIGCKRLLFHSSTSIRLLTRRKSSQYVNVTSEKHGKYSIATMTLYRPPVNSFDVCFAEEFAQTLKQIEESKHVDALILKSAHPTIFSSGLDLHELYAQPRSHLELFWRHVQDIWFRLYSSNLPTIAAINGHCLAGGTIIAGACDYRVAVDGKYGIGVTAAKIGVIAPPWFLKMLTYLMGQRNTELALQVGRVFTPGEALGIGLVDKVCSSDKLDTECWKALQPFLIVSAESRAKMKLSLRADLIDNFYTSREEDVDNFVSFILRDSVQQNLGKFIKQLKKNSTDS